MAIWKRIILDATDAQKLLGDAWYCAGQGLKYCAYNKQNKGETEKGKFRDYRSDLVTDKIEHLVSGHPIVDNYIWPIDFKVEVEANSFYVNENGQIPNPLIGHPNKRLIEATAYPFHNPDKVVAIPIRYTPDKTNTCLINPGHPNAVLFIETWTYFDRYDTTKYSTACEAFRIIDADAPGILWSKQINSVDDKIGKNFIILPYGYHHHITLKDYQYTAAEWASFYAKYSNEWKKLIQNYFDGIDQDTPQTPEIADESTTMELIRNWQAKLCDDWRGKFLSRKNLEIIKHSEEAFLQEVKNGVVLYVIAKPSITEKQTKQSADTDYEYINNVYYVIYRYTFCRSHYKAFINRLKSLQTDFGINKDID